MACGSAAACAVPADFFVAGRKLTWPLLAGTILAANIGAGTTVGTAGVAYRDGISAWWWNGSVGIGTLILALWVGPKLWRFASDRGHLTLGDYLEDRYSAGVRGIVAVLLLIGTLAILAGQLIAGAAILNAIAGTPRWAGVAIGGIAMTVYFTAGGLLSSAWVNAVQLVVMLAGLIDRAADRVEPRWRVRRDQRRAGSDGDVLGSDVFNRRHVGLGDADPADAVIHHLAWVGAENLRRRQHPDAAHRRRRRG